MTDLWTKELYLLEINSKSSHALWIVLDFAVSFKHICKYLNNLSLKDLRQGHFNLRKMST